MPPPRPVDVVCVASWNTDLVCRVPRPIARGETLRASSFEILPGGNRVLQRRHRVRAAGGSHRADRARIGCDDFGDRGMALWRDEGIETAHVVRAAGERSGVAQILVYDDGDNSIAVAPGAGAGLSASHVDAAADTIRAARVVMASCEVPLPATLRAFGIALAAGVTTLLNPAPATPLPDELLALTDGPAERVRVARAGRRRRHGEHRGRCMRGAARARRRGGRAVSGAGAARCTAPASPGSCSPRTGSRSSTRSAPATPSPARWRRHWRAVKRRHARWRGRTPRPACR